MSNDTCSVEGCEARRISRGWCAKHYRRWSRYGSTDLQVAVWQNCLECGSSLPKFQTGGKTRKFCNSECRVRLEVNSAKADRLAITRVCPVCESTFTPDKSIRRKFCSKACGKTSSRRHNSRKCSVSECNRPHRAKGLCHMHYKREGRAKGEIKPDPWTDRRRANYQKRRARKAQVPSESIAPYEVFERDGWVCGVCERPVDRSLTHPDPASASLDHVIPLSKGGGHVLENVQLAHLVCNVRKGASYPQFSAAG